MSKITIQWNHYEQDEHTCAACRATQQNLEAEVTRANQIFRHQMLTFEVKETILSETSDGNANVIHIRDQVIGATTYAPETGACECAEITAEEIRTAIYKAVGVEEPKEVDFCGCGDDGCDSGGCNCSGCNEGC